MPQVFQVTQIARPNYYDRQPISISQFYTNGLAPHVSTVRSTYTVPANRVAFMELFFLNAYRSTAAVAADIVQAYVEYVPNGGGSSRILQVQFVNNAVFAGDRNQAPSFGYMKGGDIIRTVTFDGSNGGTCSYLLAFKGIEFDV
jgi:hypothetical protein